MSGSTLPPHREELEEATFYYEVDMLQSLFSALLRWTREGGEIPYQVRRRLRAALEESQRRPGKPLPHVELDWARFERERRRRHASDADTFWDLGEST